MIMGMVLWNPASGKVSQKTSTVTAGKWTYYTILVDRPMVVAGCLLLVVRSCELCPYWPQVDPCLSLLYVVLFLLALLGNQLYNTYSRMTQLYVDVTTCVYKSLLYIHVCRKLCMQISYYFKYKFIKRSSYCQQTRQISSKSAKRLFITIQIYWYAHFVAA